MASVVNRLNPTAVSASASQTAALTLTAGTNRRVLIIATVETASETLDSATYDGASATALAAETNFGGMKMRAWEYLVPDVKAAGSYNVGVVKSAGTSSMSFTAIQVQDCHPSTASVLVSNTAGTGGATVAVSGSANNLDVIFTTHNNASASTTGTAASSQVTLGNFAENSTNFRFGRYDAVGDATETVTVTWTNGNTTTSKTAFLVVTPALVGPTITVQPVADTVILTNENTATFSVTATGTGTLLYDWELETSVGSGTYANVANGDGLTFTGGTSATLNVSLTAKTASGRRLRCNVTDDNGTTTTNAVALTIFDGPQLTTFPATNGSGVSTATLTCDYVTGVGEAIEVRIPLSDGDVAVTVTTT